MKKLLEMVNSSSYSLGMPAAANPPTVATDPNFTNQVKRKKFYPQDSTIKSIDKSTKESSSMHAVRVSSTSNRQLAKAFYELSAKGDTDSSLWTFGNVKVDGSGKFFFDIESPRTSQFFGADKLKYRLPPQVDIIDLNADRVQVGSDAPNDIKPEGDATHPVGAAESDMMIHPLVVEHMSKKD